MEVTLKSYLSQILPNINYLSAATVIELSKEGATVPFIARYRKEKTGNLDEVQIRSILEANEIFDETIKKKIFLIKEIGAQGNLTDELKIRIENSTSLDELQEIYRPFKQKKKTKATLARDAGIGPLADWIWSLGHGDIQDSVSLEVKAKDFLNTKAKFVTYDLVLKGAMDILVEKISNRPDLREFVRKELYEQGQIVSKKTKKFKEHSKYEMYADHKEPIKGLMESKASHRYLAMRRAWQEGEVTLTLEGDEEKLLRPFIEFSCSEPKSQATDFLYRCAKTALTVHVHASISTEIHSALKNKADDHAIQVFAENVRKILLSAPFGAKCVLGVDPGIRTGCKVALVDNSGRYISHTVLFTQGDGEEEKAKKLFSEVLKQIKIEAIAVGNGTAGRETEIFIRKILKDIGAEVPVILVSESGASVYSASEIAREEFPDLDLTVRGAISIARRLQDPLAELVKIDPKSIGVGQYQHDVVQNRLKKSLDDVVESCVNSVGVDINTASESLLSFVSGIGPALAKRIVEYRQKNRLYRDKEELLKIPHFSSSTFEQSAGFFRIYDGLMVLDKTGIHPERYPAVREMVHELGLNLSQIIGAEGSKKLLPLREKWSKLIGEYTFNDIIKELENPGRDPRDPYKVFAFRDDIFDIKDLKDGMICPGIVTNVTNFGAFVDIGVHQDGLVHISALANKFVDDPRKVVNPGDQVVVKVLGIEPEKKQISLSMNWDKPIQAQAAMSRSVQNEQRSKRQDRERPPRERRETSERIPKERAPSNQERNRTQSQERSFPRRNENDLKGKSNQESVSEKREFKKVDKDKRDHSKSSSKPKNNMKPKPKSKPFNNPFSVLADIKSKRE